MRKSLPQVLATLVFLAVGCGKSEQGQLQQRKLETQEPRIAPISEAPEMLGQYQAKFEEVNPVVTGKVLGSATLSLEGDEFVGDVRFSAGDLTARVLHPQSVREGSRCPGPQDDKNGDGLIDASEGEAVYGKILLPLDDDLSAQHLGLGTYPLADEFGGYVWSRSTSFKKLLGDLLETDINPTDQLLKLSSDSQLELQGRVVLIQGVALEAGLPPTVAGAPRLAANEALPVACGIFTKVNKAPGRVEEDSPLQPWTREAGGVAGRNDGTFIDPPPLPRI